MQEPTEPTVPDGRSGPSLPSLVCTIGGLLVTLSAFLPWFTMSADLSRFGAGAFSQTFSGQALLGPAVLIAGLLLMGAGVALAALRGRGTIGPATVGILVGLATAVFSIHDIVTAKTQAVDAATKSVTGSGVPTDQAQRILDLFHFNISVQVGAFVAVIGAILGLAAGILALARRPKPAPVLVAGTVSPPPPELQMAVEEPTVAAPALDPAVPAALPDEEAPSTA
ncbi:MAG: Trp biosynthesis-associated membrane protein [Actinomycetota bacterium]|nr:Trp biosynthesis-associated membrane protein [Actinomycetota bacterium]